MVAIRDHRAFRAYPRCFREVGRPQPALTRRRSPRSPHRCQRLLRPRWPECWFCFRPSSRRPGGSPPSLYPSVGRRAASSSSATSSSTPSSRAADTRDPGDNRGCRPMPDESRTLRPCLDNPGCRRTARLRWPRRSTGSLVASGARGPRHGRLHVRGRWDYQFATGMNSSSPAADGVRSPTHPPPTSERSEPETSKPVTAWA